MKVLLLTQVLPYPQDAGPKIKTLNLLRHLAQGGHEVVLVSFIRSPAEREYASHLAQYCQEIRMVPIKRSLARDLVHLARSLCENEPFFIARDSSQEFSRAVQSAMADHQFDLLHADQLSMAQYVLDINHIPRLLDEHIAVWTLVHEMYRDQRPGLKKAVLRLETGKMKRYEGRVCRAFDHVLAVSEQDLRALEEAGVERERVTVVPIGVDSHEKQLIQRRPGASDIVSLGGMFYPPNVEGAVWFAREAFPLVKRRLPQTRFYIIGARPPRIVRDLAARDENIIVTGYVPDPTPYLQEAAALVAPLMSGGGMRTKILTSFATGIPVVSTAFGCEGIDATQGKEILLAENASDFAEAVCRLIEDKPFADRMTSNARRLIEEKYDWRVAYRAIDAVYDRLTCGRDKARTLRVAGPALAGDGGAR